MPSLSLNFFFQVLGKGKIVTKRWIEDCHIEKRRLPWRDYRLDDGSDGSDSDDGASKKSDKRPNGDPNGSSNSNGSTHGRSDRTNDLAANNVKTPTYGSRSESQNVKDEEEEEEEEFAGTTDVDSDVEDSSRPGGPMDDDPDTEDELQRVIERTKGIYQLL